MSAFRAIPLILIAAATLAAAETAMLSNSDFETDADKNSKPDDWALQAGTSWEVEGGNHFLRLTAAGPSTQVSVFREIPVNDAKAVKISFRVRYTNVKRGAQPWYDARVIMECKDEKKAVMKGALPHPFFTGSSPWVEKTFTRVLPEGAKTITVMPALFMIESGTFDLDDFSIVAIDPAQVTPAPTKP